MTTKTAETAVKVCDWAAGDCGQPATHLLLEGRPHDVFVLYRSDTSWRPMCAAHIEMAALCLTAGASDFCTVTRRIDP